MDGRIAGRLLADEKMVTAGAARIPLGKVPHQFLLRGYHLVLTDQRLLGFRYSRLLGRPDALAFQVPRAQVAVRGGGGRTAALDVIAENGKIRVLLVRTDEFQTDLFRAP